MKSNAYRTRLVVRLMLATICYTLGSLPASAQGSGPMSRSVPVNPSPSNQTSEGWLNDFPGLNLVINKKKSRLTPSRGSVTLSRPFGGRGPALQISRSLPEYAQRSHRMADVHGTARSERTDAYLFLEKRW